MPRLRSALRLILALLALSPASRAAEAQEPQRAGALVTGRVLEAQTGAPIDAALVTVEGTGLSALSDSTGRYRLAAVPPGPQVLLVERLGYATARIPITVPAAGTLARDIEMGISALELEGLIVTADRSGRARGELGTASVIDRDAIANQTAASLAEILELLPGIPLQPPGLEGTQQIPLRTVPTSSIPTLLPGGPSPAAIAAFGTLIILDGVPLSNNANLQSLGPRGELQIPTSAGGGVDLRRLPASTIERVEVIRGVPSARYGDFTQGVIVVDTRAGAVEPTVGARYDARLVEGSLVAGRQLGAPHTATANLDLANSEVSPGLSDDNVSRVTTQLAHRGVVGHRAGTPPGQGRLVLDSRIDFFQVFADNPEDPEIQPGRASSNRDSGLRISERARLALAGAARLELTTSLDYTRRRSFAQSELVRGALPVTDRTTEGRSIGRFIDGPFLSSVTLDGDEWLLFTRLEGVKSALGFGFDHDLRLGAVLRREWNTGAGFQFDIEAPPQVTFNGVQGFDRPRRFDEVPPVATSALYLDDRMVGILSGGVGLDLQAGLRLDLLHDGTQWLSGVRDAVAQPRLNLQVTPWPWLRLRGAWGRTAKLPPLSQLFPPPQYFDVVNVNFFTIDPAERLAVLTTFIRDPTNPSLGFATGRKAELGIEFAPKDASIALVAFSDRTDGAVGFDETPQFLLRERFQLSDSTEGNGVPPEIIEPASAIDTVPILIGRPANNLTLRSEGFELSAALPELRPLRTRLDVQGALMRTRFFKDGLDFGRLFGNFQLDENVARAPFWEDPILTGERGIITYRLIHHQPALGLVVTATIQHFFREKNQNIAGTDSLAFAGFITRDGSLVRVPPEQRGNPEFADLRQPRSGIFIEPTETPADFLMSLQVSKTLPRGGRLSFWAFNALDRMGRFSESGFGSRQFAPLRFGVELMLPLGGLAGR